MYVAFYNCFKCALSCFSTWSQLPTGLQKIVLLMFFILILSLFVQNHFSDNGIMHSTIATVTYLVSTETTELGEERYLHLFS